MRQKLLRLLRESSSSAVVVDGPWGIGKTHVVGDVVPELCGDDGKPVMVSWVSIFGIEDLATLRRRIGRAASRSSAGSLLHVHAADIAGGRNFFAHVKSLSTNLDKLVRLADGLMIEAVRGRVVVIDDVERISNSLSLKTLLGEVNLLATVFECRVIMITNLAAFSSENRELFDRFGEKIFDHRIAFERSVAECVEVVYSDSDWAYRQTVDAITGLGITNIRTLKRIKAALKSLQPLFRQSDSRVIEKVVRSVVLARACVDDNGATLPPLSYLQEYSPFLKPEVDNNAFFATVEESSQQSEDRERKKRESVWHDQLSAYGYNIPTRLENAVQSYVVDGDLDETLISELKIAEEQLAEEQCLANKYFDVWSSDYYSLNISKEEFCDKVRERCVEAIDVLSVQNVNWSVKFLKEAGRDLDAGRILKLFFDSRRPSEFQGVKGAFHHTEPVNEIREWLSANLVRGDYRERTPRDFLIDLGSVSLPPSLIKELPDVVPSGSVLDVLRQLEPMERRSVLVQALILSKSTTDSVQRWAEGLIELVEAQGDMQRAVIEHLRRET